MDMMKEFKEFAMRGNVLDMAVGVIMGAAFGKIITSLVGDIIMPPIGKIMGNINFNDLFVNLDPVKAQGIKSLADAKQAGVAVIAYGAFLNTIIDFVIVSFCIFLMVKGLNKLKAPPVTAGEPTTKECPYCISTIPFKATKCGHCTSAL